jgi:hypothetical protein
VNNSPCSQLLTFVFVLVEALQRAVSWPGCCLLLLLLPLPLLA